MIGNKEEKNKNLTRFQIKTRIRSEIESPYPFLGTGFAPMINLKT